MATNLINKFLLAVYFWRTHKENVGKSTAEQKIYRSNKIEHEERTEDVATVMAGETCLIHLLTENTSTIYTEKELHLIVHAQLRRAVTCMQMYGSAYMSVRVLDIVSTQHTGLPDVIFQ